jgi:uncharacterized protein YggE
VIKRIGLLMVAALVAAMMMAASAAPAFAQAGGTKCPGPGDFQGSKCRFGGSDGKKNTIKVTGNGTCTTSGGGRGLCNNQ